MFDTDFIQVMFDTDYQDKLVMFDTDFIKTDWQGLTLTLSRQIYDVWHWFVLYQACCGLSGWSVCLCLWWSVIWQLGTMALPSHAPVCNFALIVVELPEGQVSKDRGTPL